jgi:hypothetical protein
MSDRLDVEARAQEAKLLTAMRAQDMRVLSSSFDSDCIITGSVGEVWGRERALRDHADPGTSFARLDGRSSAWWRILATHTSRQTAPA